MNHRISLLTLLIAGALASTTGFAQTTTSEPVVKPSGEAGTSGGRHGGRPDPAQIRKMLDERFKKADTDSDGFLSKEEAEKGMPMVGRRFAEIDANKDGKISREEIDKAMAHREQRGQHGKDGQKHSDERFKKADKNGDGFLSKDEVTAASPLVRDFDKIDTNKDGKLSREEIRAYADERRKARQAGQSK